MSGASVRQLLLLHPADNVMIAMTGLSAEAECIMDGDSVRILNDTPIGHKVARHNMPAGTRILRYGAPIGTLTKAVARGGHVHSHNLSSDYIPAHDRSAEQDGPANGGGEA